MDGVPTLQGEAIALLNCLRFVNINLYDKLYIKKIFCYSYENGWHISKVIRTGASHKKTSLTSLMCKSR